MKPDTAPWAESEYELATTDNNSPISYTGDGGEGGVKTVYANGASKTIYGGNQPGVWQATSYAFPDTTDLIVESNNLPSSGSGYWGFDYAYVIE